MTPPPPSDAVIIAGCALMHIPELGLRLYVQYVSVCTRQGNRKVHKNIF